MTRPRYFTQIVHSATFVAVLFGNAGAVRAAIGFEPSWRPPAYEDVRREVASWLSAANLDDDAARAIRQLWREEPVAGSVDADLLERLAKSFALASPDAAELVTLTTTAYSGPSAAPPNWLSGPDVPKFVRHNLRLYYARWLAQYGLYDEVLEQVKDLRPADVVDPAALLFYQMVAHHQLVEPDEARIALAQLLEQEKALPRRFQQVAHLVDRDLKSLEDESLDHIARRMRDIRRRLDYGRAGAHVQKIERGVVDSLDKTIDDLEKQQQQQQSAASSGSSQSSRPMEDSRPAELKAPMQVDRRDIGSQSDWGDLPPKEREQALQQIGREFPAHYRELIEQYFRELAAESSPQPGE